MKHYLIFISTLACIFLAVVFFWAVQGVPDTTPMPVTPVTPTTTLEPEITVTNFEECARVTGVVMESYPRQCRYNGQTYTEHVGNELEKSDLIQLSNPRPNQVISTPLTITGQARGNWFFEATFPIQLVNWDGLIIADGYATAQGDWMTTEFVPFTATLTFEYPTVYDRGALILQKSNASGLPEYDDALEIPVRFSSTSTIEVMY